MVQKVELHGIETQKPVAGENFQKPQISEASEFQRQSNRLFI